MNAPLPPADCSLDQDVLRRTLRFAAAIDIVTAVDDRYALTETGRLLLIASPADFTGAFYDLHMQVLLGGRERTAEEFRELLRSAGLNLNRILPTGSPLQVLEVSC